MESQCTGCGKQGASISRRIADLCSECQTILQGELEARKHIGPRFFASYWTGKNTLGHGLYISKTPAEAMSESQRVALHNGWELLRLDIQRTLEDIYVHRNFQKYFPGSKKSSLEYDENKYEPVSQ